MTTLADLIDNHAAAQARLSFVAYKEGDAAAQSELAAHHLHARRALFQRLELLVSLQIRMEAFHRNLDAPGGDESKARPPTGEDYNDVMEDVRSTLKLLIGADAPTTV